MNKKPSDKKNSSQGVRKLAAHSGTSESVSRKMSDPQHKSSAVRESKPVFYCNSITESERQKFIVRMSPESIKISSGTKWSEKGFVPSFKNTDAILMEAARRTYNTHGINRR